MSAERFIAGAREVVGPAQVQVGAGVEPRFLEPARYATGAASAVVRPETAEQVAQLIALAARCDVRLVPQGAHTGLVHGATPQDAARDVVLSSERLRGTFELDALDATLRVSAGYRLGEVNTRLRELGFHFPVDLSADPSIGGMLATNAGGTRMMRHGDMRANTLGLTVALASPAGELLCLGPALPKNNAAIDAKHLFIGTGGAFGMVVEAVLRLQRLPRQRAVAMVALRSIDTLWPFYDAACSAFGDSISAFEGISGLALELALRHGPGLRAPFESGLPAHAVLLELSSAFGPDDLALDRALADFLEAALDKAQIVDAVVGDGEALWDIRHRLGEGLRAHGEVMGLDLSFPRRAYAAFAAEARAWLAGWNPALQVADFGHLGDGGVHFNLVWPRGTLAPAQAAALRARLYEMVARHGGSFSAEHGVGPQVQAAYEAHTPPGQLALARRLVGALAPDGELGTLRYAPGMLASHRHQAPAQAGEPHPAPAVRPLYGQATGSPIRAMLSLASLPDMVSLAGGHPDPALLPLEGVREALLALADERQPGSLQYGATEGLPALREASAALLRARGVLAPGDEVVVTTGSQQAIDLLSRVLVQPGDAVAVARFNYPAAMQSLRFAGARLVPVEGDAQGLRIDDLARQLETSGARVLYLVPNFGNPGGDLLSLERRRQLLDLAARRDVTVIEDDPYGELWFDAAPPPSLAALNRQAGAPARVAYLASFSKTVAPALRLGVLHAPAEILRAVVIAKQAADIHSGTLEQRVLAALLTDARLGPHIAGLRAAYAHKRDVLLEGLARHCGRTLTFDRPGGGMFVWARTQPGVPLLPGDAWVAFGQRHRVLVVPGAAFSATAGADAAPEPWLRLSFAHPSPAALAIGAERLGAGLDALIR